MYRWIKGTLLFLFIVTLCGTACGREKPIEGYSYIQYGEEGSDTSLLVVQSGDLFGFADTAGRAVIKPQYDEVHPFYEGLAVVKKKGKWGYIDKSGNIVIPFAYTQASDFHAGTAIVTESRFLVGDLHLMITQKNQIAKILYITRFETCSYSNGEWTVFTEYEVYHYPVDDSGSATPETQTTPESSETLQPVFNEEARLWGFEDPDGKIVIDCKYDKVSPFYNGIAEVLLNGKIGYIDRTGKYIWEPK